MIDRRRTSYVPANSVVEKGGTLDESNLAVFVRFARAAMRGMPVNKASTRKCRLSGDDPDTGFQGQRSTGN